MASATAGLASKAFPSGTVPLLVDGVETADGLATFTIEDPSTGRVFLRATEASSNDVDASVLAAEAALPAWNASPVTRARALVDAGRRLAADEDALAVLETLETGKPLSQSRADVRAAARYFEYYGGLVEGLLGTTVPLTSEYHALTLREPYGVTVHIIPWNSPVSQFARGVAPALAAGNTAVVKTSQRAPAAVLHAARLMIEAGVPAGACSVLSGPGSSVGIELIRHPLTALVVFTGSTQTGRRILVAAADSITPCKLELGGKSADLVFDDADLDRAVSGAIASLTRNAGQSCYASTRVLVHESRYRPFVDRLVEAVSAIRIGPGLKDLDMGPLSSASHLQASVNAVDAAIAAGATALTGGRPVAVPGSDGGHFMAPTLVEGAAQDSPIAQEELFAPILTLFTFASEADAVSMANATPYGLAAGIFTRSQDRVIRVARQLHAGQVHVNGPAYAGVELPFGGVKQSGIGHEKGVLALDEYARSKSVVVRL